VEPLDSPPVQQETWTSQGIVADVRRGLTDDPKWLSSLYFYDAAGSQLFEEICRTPEYYPTRTETALLTTHGHRILERAGAPLVVGELGSGSSAKTRILLDALIARQGPSTYYPVDVSRDFLADVATRLEAAHAGLSVHPLAAEYHDGLRQIGEAPVPVGGRRLVLFLGSSIGNFEPSEQLDLLRAARAALAPGDAFLLGTDLVKDEAVLHAAYNDAAGVTARFNKNILTRIARELGADVDVDAFQHVAFWNAHQSRIEMHLESRRDHVLHLHGAALDVHMRKGERIHTENSYKFTLDAATALARRAGWELEHTWTDGRNWFGLHLLRRP
jgi:dimethylhistidine N-methyltransferase